MAKRTTKKYDLETGVLTIHFVNGSVDFDIDALPEDMKRKLYKAVELLNAENPGAMYSANSVVRALIEKFIEEETKKK